MPAVQTASLVGFERISRAFQRSAGCGVRGSTRRTGRIRGSPLWPLCPLWFSWFALPLRLITDETLTPGPSPSGRGEKDVRVRWGWCWLCGLVTSHNFPLTTET